MNQKLFKTWTAESAYFLGVVAVVGDAEGAKISITAPTADHAWLRRVAAILGLKKVSAGGTFSVQDKHLMDPLWTLKKKHGSLVDAVPDEFFHHFARAMLDAGGTSSPTTAIITGKISSLRKVRDRLMELAELSDKSSIDSEPDSQPALKFVDDDVPKLAKFLYKECEDLCLPARQQGFEQAKETDNEPRELHRPRSKRPQRAGSSGKGVRSRTRKGSEYDPLVWQMGPGLSW